MQINGLNNNKTENGRVKQISLQINGLNIKLVNGERKTKKKNRSFTDQWFKLKQNTKRTTRSIKKKPEKQQQTKEENKVGRFQSSRTNDNKMTTENQTTTPIKRRGKDELP